MHWFKILLIVLLSVSVLAAMVLFGIMLSNRPSEVDSLAGQAFGDLRFAHSQGEDQFQLPEDMDEYDRMISRMSESDLEAEFRRVLVGGAAADPTIQERDERALQLLNHLANTALNGNATGEGDGIVVCAGGYMYGTCAYVLIKRLRQQGCTLPIEVWHRHDEMGDEMQKLFEDLSCDVRNIDAVSSTFIDSRFAIKPMAMIHSKFQRVLMLDADNLTLYDPSRLFDMLDEHPAVFWQDNWPLDRKAACWKLLKSSQGERVNYPNAQDSGQLLVDKVKCAKALFLCGRINLQLHSQLSRLFPEPFNQGDKDTWHFAWLCTDTPYYMIPHRPGGVGRRDASGQYIGNAMVHYDKMGQPLFLHTCWSKLSHQARGPLWTDYYRFTTNAGHVDQWTHRFDDAPVIRTLAVDILDSTEEECWDELKHLRGQTWYQSAFEAQLKEVM